jgi:hypothetical protein
MKAKIGLITLGVSKMDCHAGWRRLAMTILKVDDRAYGFKKRFTSLTLFH